MLRTFHLVPGGAGRHGERGTGHAGAETGEDLLGKVHPGADQARAAGLAAGARGGSAARDFGKSGNRVLPGQQEWAVLGSHRLHEARGGLRPGGYSQTGDRTFRRSGYLTWLRKRADKTTL